MADTKISALGTKTAVGATDLLPIVDVSDTTMAASGTDKSIVPAALFQPARFASIANGSPADGDVWYGSAQKALVGYLDGINHRFVGCLFSQVADQAITNTTTETTLFNASGAVGTLTLPANFLAVGKTLRVTLYGDYSTAAASPGQYTIKVKLGGVTLLDSTGLSLPASAAGWPLAITVLIACRSTGVSGSVYASGPLAIINSSSGGYKAAAPTPAAGTVDTTGTLALDVTWKFSAASASNVVTTRVATVEALN